MKIFRKALVLFLSFLLISVVHSTEIYPIVAPEWTNVSPLKFNYNIPKDELQDGIYYLLVDSQTRIDKDSSVRRFKRFVTHIVNPTGVEKSSQIDISYDPNYQKIQIHAIRVWRNGQPNDKISTAKITILQQEKELDNLIYNGNETVNFVLDDIRVGDVLDYSYSIIGQNPVYDGIFSQSNYFQWTIPVLHRSVRLLWFKDEILNIKQHHGKFEIQRTQLKNGIEYSISQRNIRPLRSEKNTPDWFDKYPFIEFSETKSWRQVVNWSIPLFNNALSSESSIQDLARKIRSETSSKSEQLLKALHYVQQEIRYLGIEIGENSHRPSAANETLQRRYGDCKDKTVLLISILKQLGIEAYPALVNTDLGDELLNRLPKPGAFDHVIVKAILGVEVYWLDPTRLYQNSDINQIFQPDYDQALVVSNRTSQLEAPVIDHTNNLMQTTDEFILGKDYDQPVIFRSTSKMSGLSAEQNRSSFASKGLAPRQDHYKS